MSLKVFKSEERQHSPSVFQVAAAAGGRKVVDFCYLSNKFFPTPEILTQLAENLEEIVRNYPSMQTEQCELAGAVTETAGAIVSPAGGGAPPAVQKSP